MVEYDVEAFRKRSSHYKPSSECMDECYEQTDDSTESDTPANDIDHGEVEALCDDIDIEPPGSDNYSVLQLSDNSECMSSASGGENCLSSSSSDQINKLQDYTSEISDDFSVSWCSALKS